MSRLQAVQCCSGQAGAGAVADREGLWSDRCSIGSRRVTFIRRLGPRTEAGDEIEHRASPERKASNTGPLTIGAQAKRSEESSVGKEGGGTCRSRRWADDQKKNEKEH